MSDMSDRVKMALKAAGLSQTAFAEKTGLAKSSVSMICSGANKPSEHTKRDICSFCNVRREWLETGDGEMMQKRTRNEELVDFMNRVQDMPESKMAQLIAAMSRLTDEQWEAFADLIVALANKPK